jgi:hypothetical protein
MSTKHTPEPWYTDSDRFVDFIYSDREKVCQFHNREKDDFDNKVANAKRIVDCVNAMEGIEDPMEFVRKAQEMREALELIIKEEHPKSDPYQIAFNTLNP